jgi:hypothetical protein
MLNRLMLVLLLFFFAQCGLPAAPPAAQAEPDLNTGKPVRLSPGVYDVPIVLSPSLEGRRSEFRHEFINAQANLRAFAKQYGWEHLTDDPFTKQLEICDNKDGWDDRLRQIDPETPAVIPKTFSACIEHEIFLCVSPDIYFANYPDGREADAFQKLMTHELAHRLHVRICKNDDEKMGPIWFFEGFAIYAADQLNHNVPKLSNGEIWSIVSARDRGSYTKYNVVFRHFLKGTALQEYVQKAEEPKFIDWLKEQESLDAWQQAHGFGSNNTRATAAVRRSH